VQVEPIKPALKAPGTKRLTLNYDEVLSSSAFNFNLRRCNKDGSSTGVAAGPGNRSLFQLNLGRFVHDPI
jgi:hypothetical protein